MYVVSSFSGTLLFGLLQGLFLSIVASMIAIMAQTKRPFVTILGKAKDGTFV
jgi:hypothetical protein